jgi:hypothetical protein
MNIFSHTEPYGKHASQEITELLRSFKVEAGAKYRRIILCQKVYIVDAITTAAALRMCYQVSKSAQTPMFP